MLEPTLLPGDFKVLVGVERATGTRELFESVGTPAAGGLNLHRRQKLASFLKNCRVAKIVFRHGAGGLSRA